MIFDNIYPGKEGSNYLQSLSQIQGFAGSKISAVAYNWSTFFQYNVTGGGASGNQYVTLNETQIFAAVTANTQPTIGGAGGNNLNWFYYGFLEVWLTPTVIGAVGLSVQMYNGIEGVFTPYLIYNNQTLTVAQGSTRIYTSGQIAVFNYFAVSANNSAGNSQFDLSFHFNGVKVFVS